MNARLPVALSLRRLNTLLGEAFVRARKAFEEAQQLYKIPYGEPGFRGLAVEPDQAIRILIQRGFGLEEGVTRWVAETRKDQLYLELGKKLGLRELTEIDFGILMLGVAPEYDTDYERLFGFIQDDVTRRRASVELAVDLFAPIEEARSRVLERFAASAPLVAGQLIELVEPGEGRSGPIGAAIRCDQQLTRWLLGVPRLDPRLAEAARLVRPVAASVPLGSVPATIRRDLALLFLGHPSPPAPPVRLHLYGADRRLNALVAEVLAWCLRNPGGRRPDTPDATVTEGLPPKWELLVVDAVRFAAAPSVSEASRLLAREARWFDRVVFIDGVDALLHTPERQRVWAELTAALSAAPPVPYVIASGAGATLPPAPHPTGFASVALPQPDAPHREAIWKAAAQAAGAELPPEDVRELAQRYALSWSQIESAAQDAAAHARLAADRSDAKGGTAGPAFDDFANAARAQGGHDLETLTHKIAPRAELNDLVVAADVRAQLDEVVGRVRNRAWVLTDWEFGRRHSHGHGVNALFAGPSGTGKTMAAEAIARAIGKDLHKIDLTSVVSKYIGETEQKLEQIFQAGEATQAVLFFDEADSLLGKRSEVKDAHDRYANLEVSYLLQRMERYDGLIVLATNLLGNLDEAFLRRMSAIVHFPPPGPTERLRLWQRVWPGAVPLLGRVEWPESIEPEERPRFAVDPVFLANRFELTGGNIRNAALAAAFSAAERREWFGFVSMWDVLHGVRREYQKLGQAATDEELGLDLYEPPPPKPDVADKLAAREQVAPAGAGA